MKRKELNNKQMKKGVGTRTIDRKIARESVRGKGIRYETKIGRAG